MPKYEECNTANSEDSYSTRSKGQTIHYLRAQPKDLLLAAMFKDVTVNCYGPIP